MLVDRRLSTSPAVTVSTDRFEGVHMKHTEAAACSQQARLALSCCADCYAHTEKAGLRLMQRLLDGDGVNMPTAANARTLQQSR